MKSLIISIKVFLIFTIITGIIYPLLITGITQVLFPAEANGSLIINGNKTIGSELIGQQFDSIIYFTSRPSSINYKALPSGGSNYGLTNRKLKELLNQRKQQFISFNNLDSTAIIPSEMLFASASGLDPHISKQAALLQVNRIKAARNFNDLQNQKILQCIESLTEAPLLLVSGQERVNVLLLNLGLDKIK